MDWMNWVLLAVVVATAGVVAFLRMKGHLTTDAATVCIGAVVELVRRAEKLWRGYQGSGAQKKEWVLMQLKLLGEKYDATAAGEMIDAVVAWLNATKWE